MKRVHDDVVAMIERGLVERNAEGQLYVPYEAVHAAFDLRAAA